MRNLVAFPLLALALILQSSIVSQVKLLSGYADLLLIMIAAWALQERVRSAWHWAVIACAMLSFVSKLPWPTTLIGYLAIVFVAQALQRRVWQAPLLAMFTITFIGTLFMNFLSYVVLLILGTPYSLSDVVGLIALPSLLLNMLFSIPVYTFMRDLARWVYPSEEFE